MCKPPFLLKLNTTAFILETGIPSSLGIFSYQPATPPPGEFKLKALHTGFCAAFNTLNDEPFPR
jgi:hypothetical protein